MDQMLGLDLSVVGLLTVVMFYAVGIGLIALFGKLTGFGRGVLVPLGVVVVVAPWADEVWIAWHFQKLCKDSGVHVFRSVTADGYLDETYEANRDISPTIVADLEKRGYAFYENRSKDKYVRKEKIDGKWQVFLNDRPTARYHYKQTREGRVGHELAAHESVVIDTQTGEVIGREAIYKRYSSWLIGLFGRMFGGGMKMCPDPESAAGRQRFPEAVLTPIHGRKGP